MPLPSSLVGASSENAVCEIDPRWSMAYAAAIGDLIPSYMDTRAPGLVTHPLFPVCFEWPVIVSMAQRFHGTELTAAEARRGVHATHTMTIHRAIAPPEKLITRATIVAIERRKPGAYQVTRLDTHDESGAIVCTSWYGSIYRGVDVAGPDRPLEAKTETPAAKNFSQPRSETAVRIGGGLAHTYTECARIYNPIHTDIKVAHDAGLPGLILHGTATLAIAVSRIVATEAGGDPRRIKRIAGRFNAMVLMPSEINVRVLTREPLNGAEIVRFDVLNQERDPAVSGGMVVVGQ